MIDKRICCLLSAAFFLAGCSGVKKSLDTVRANTDVTSPEVYRGSYPKVTDIIHTRLDISFNWDSAFVIGKAYIDARPYLLPLRQLTLNAKGFRIYQVSLIKKNSKLADDQEVKPLTYNYNGKELTIQLDKTYTKDEKYTVLISYIAMPNKLEIGKDITAADSRGIYFINPDGKDKELPRQVWTQGKSECNSNWFPTIEGPQEKMTQEINITVPEKMKTLSNGELDFSSSNGDGTRTDSWRLEKPHSTYLTMLAAGNFSITKDKWRDIEVSYYTEPGYAPYARLVFGKTPQMLEFFSKRTGVDYPWEKYSQIVVRNFVGGGMENTTATVLFDKLNMGEGQYLDENCEEYISHELFHQWFGDLVTCESWANLPLNESFATYGEYLWNEFKYGRDYADYYGMKDLDVYLSNPKNALQNVIRYNYPDKGDMFDDVTYAKGGRILHMLRKTLGDDIFFKSLTLYLTRFAYKTAEIHDLRLVFEEVSGQDLNWFFNQWFLSSGHPRLSFQTRYNAGEVSVTIKQLQDVTRMPVYKIPMAIDIYTKQGVERKDILLDRQEQTFTFPAGSKPDLVNVDAEKYLVCEKSENKTLPEYIFQYENAPLFLDRFEAVNAFISAKNDKAARMEMIRALKDKNWYIRKLAVDFIPELDEEERNTIYPALKKMAVSDERSYVRASAVTVLNKTFKNRDNKDVFAVASKDKAPSVIRAIAGL